MRASEALNNILRGTCLCSSERMSRQDIKLVVPFYLSSFFHNVIEHFGGSVQHVAYESYNVY